MHVLHHVGPQEKADVMAELETLVEQMETVMAERDSAQAAATAAAQGADHHSAASLQTTQRLTVSSCCPCFMISH